MTPYHSTEERWTRASTGKLGRKSGRRRRRLAQAVLAAMTATVMALATACGTGSGDAGAGSTPTVRIAVPVADISLIQIWIAQLGGFFKQQNVDVKMDIVGSNTTTSVVSGQDDLAMGGVLAPMTVKNKGRDTTVVYWVNGKRSSGFIFGNNNIRSVSDCKKVVASPEGTSPYGWAVAYRKALGLDYQISSFTDSSAVTSSVVSGQADCNVGNYGPFGVALAQGKAHILLDPRNIDNVPPSLRDHDFVEASYWGLTDNVKKNRDAVTRFLKANQQALQVMRSSTPEQLATTLLQSNDWKNYDAKLLADLLKVQSFAWGPNDGKLDSATWTSCLQFANEGGLPFVNPTDPQWAYDKRVDMSYLDDANK